MTSRRNLEEIKTEARRLRGGGMTIADIAREVGRTERTVYNWFGEEPVESKSRFREWPDEQRWPISWTVDRLSDLPGFDRDAWEGNLAKIQVAEAENDHYTGWFFRRLVELARRSPMPDGTLPWALAIAALPCLGEWLNCTAFTTLAELIEKHRPWEASNGLIKRRSPARRAYLREATDASKVVKQCLRLAQSNWTQRGLLRTGNFTIAPVLFAALYARVPEFDRTPRLAFSRLISLDSAIMGLLSLPKERLT